MCPINGNWRARSLNNNIVTCNTIRKTVEYNKTNLEILSYNQKTENTSVRTENILLFISEIGTDIHVKQFAKLKSRFP